MTNHWWNIKESLVHLIISLLKHLRWLKQPGYDAVISHFQPCTAQPPSSCVQFPPWTGGLWNKRQRPEQNDQHCADDNSKLISSLKTFEFYWNMFPRLASQHWFKWWLDPKLTTHLNPCWSCAVMSYGIIQSQWIFPRPSTCWFVFRKYEYIYIHSLSFLDIYEALVLNWYQKPFS